MMEVSLRITYAAAHVLWAGALVALLVALLVFAVDRWFIRSAAGRHAVHLCGLILTAVILPVSFFMAPVNAGRPAPPLMKTAGEVGVPSRAESLEQVTDAKRVAPVRAGNSVKEISRDGGRLLLAEERSVASLERIAPWVAGAYLLGVFGMVARLALGFAGSGRIRRQSDPVEAGEWTRALQRMAASFGVRVRPGLKWSRDVAAPVIIGVVKPAILLPVALASRLSPAQVEAVLAHELAHLRRGDPWALAVQRVVETILFFHPAVWWMSHQMEAAREEACDDLVLAAGCDPADYAEALVTCSECRLERRRALLEWASHVAATGQGGEHLRRRVLRLIGSGDDGAVRLGRTGWALALVLVGGAALVLATRNVWWPGAPGFDVDDLPPAYEKGIKVADRNQQFGVGELKFQASPLRWEKEGWLRLPENEHGSGQELFLDLGISGGYEIVEIRLFDHATRELIHDGKWRKPDVAHPEFLVERIGASNWLRIKETGGTFPDRIDVWLRLAIQGAGHTFVLPAETGASASHDGSQVVITKLLAGWANGKSGPTGEMEWDLTTLHGGDNELTVNLENRGKPLGGRYHLVAVTRDGSRHPMDHTHFWDFQKMRPHAYFHMDVALADTGHFELIPFEDRSKFFFNGLEVPGRKQISLKAADATLDFGAAVADSVVRVIESHKLPFVNRESLREIHTDFAVLVREHQRNALDDRRKRAILASIEEKGAEHFKGYQLGNARSVNHAYLTFPDRIKTLQWKVFMAVSRAPLSGVELADQNSQRQWMRNHVRSLPLTRFNTIEAELARLESVLDDPLCAVLDRPMADGTFKRFQERLQEHAPDQALPYVVAHIVREALWASYPGFTDFVLPFDDQVRSFGISGNYTYLEFESNRWFAGDTRALRTMEEEFTMVEATTGDQVSAPSDRREPSMFTAWVEQQGGSHFGLSREEGLGFVALPGARLALLNVRNWIEADAITDDSLRARVGDQSKSRVELTPYQKASRSSRGEVMGPYIGIMTKAGRLAVVHVEDLSAPDEIAYRVRPRPGAIVLENRGQGAFVPAPGRAVRTAQR